MKPLHILFWLAVSSPLLALIPCTQDPAATDWPKEVERACTAPRYGLRVAAAKKVAAAGRAAVPAIRAFMAKRGANELPVTLVEAIASDDGIDAEVVDLLLEWDRDRDFYWRAQALKGLAIRAPLLPGRSAALQELFKARSADPAWLVRVHARLGLALLVNIAGLGTDDPDPRAVPKWCALMLQYGRTPELQPLFDALLDERTFLQDEWGKRRASEAAKALRAWLGDDLPALDGAAAEDKGKVTEAMLAVARKKSGELLSMPAPQRDAETRFTGGIEILSCRSGDLFVQWTATGELHFGLDGAKVAQLPAPVWDELSRERAALQLDTNHGVVICDNMRLRWDEPAVHTKVAPQALPDAAAKWLAHLAKALQEADQPRLAEALRAGLEQFGAH